MASKLLVYSPEQHLTSERRERIIFYGRGGRGKTRLALATTPRFGDMLYYAADPGSEELPSISPKKAERIYKVIPDADNPIASFWEFAGRNWQTIYPTVKTLVVDTYTQVIDDCLQYSANTGAVTAEKHYKVGDPDGDGGQVIPNRGDFRAISSLSRGFIKRLFDKQREMNIIFVMHEESKKITEDGVYFGGPSHAGWDMSEVIVGVFGTVVRVIKEPVLVPGEQVAQTRVIAVTEDDGRYTAKLRENDEEAGNPMPRIILDANSENFFVDFDHTMLNQKE